MKKILSLTLFFALILSLCCVTGAVSVGQTFSYSDPDWGKGENVTSDGLWMYEWFDRETDSFADMDWCSDGYFEAQFSTAAASDVHWYCRIRTNGKNLHPGARADAVKTFVCPESGEVRISITCQRQSDVSGNNNGNSVRLMLNDEIVPIDGEDEIMLDDKSTLEIDETIEVEKGDLIRFMIGSQGNSSGDGVDVPTHKIKYLSGAGLEEEKPSFTITCVGDSITEGMGTTGGLKGVNAYPAVLEGLLDATGVADFTVNNCGKSATTALKNGDRPYKECAEYRSSLKTDPDVVIICLGANDSKAANWNAAQYELDYQNLIKEYMDLESKPTVYLFYTTYVADQSKTGCTRAVIQKEILPIQDAIAEKLGLKIIDLNTLTKKNSTKYADGVHPNDELQAMMAEYIFNALCAEGVGGLTAKNATETVSMIDPSAVSAPSTDAASHTGSDTSSVTDTATDKTADSTASSDASLSVSSDTNPDGDGGNNGWIVWVVVAAAVVLLAGAAVCVIFAVKKKK